MYKPFLHILFCLLPCALRAQENLVPNPSFEELVDCPNGTNQIDYAMNWFSARESPDYLHTCSESLTFVPGTNTFGYQYPASGNGYAGIYTYFNSEYREVIGTQLTSPLVVHQKYFVSFKVSRGGGGLWNTHGATNKVGVLFSTRQYSVSSPVPISNFAHVYVDSIITDTISWVTVSGVFIADSAYQYANIGNFFNDANTDTLCLGWSCNAGYFIDDVSVLQIIEPIEIPNVFTPNGDGKNDVFSVLVTGYSDGRLRIYNRWGAQVFCSSGTIFEWNGTQNGTDLSIGVYFAILELTDVNNNRMVRKGFVHLLR